MYAIFTQFTTRRTHYYTLHTLYTPRLIVAIIPELAEKGLSFAVNRDGGVVFGQPRGLRGGVKQDSELTDGLGLVVVRPDSPVCVW